MACTHTDTVRVLKESNKKEKKVLMFIAEPTNSNNDNGDTIN